MTSYEFKKLKTTLTHKQIADYLGIDQNDLMLFSKNKKQLSVDVMERLEDLFSYNLNLDDMSTDELKGVAAISKVANNLKHMNAMLEE